MTDTDQPDKNGIFIGPDTPAAASLFNVLRSALEVRVKGSSRIPVNLVSWNDNAQPGSAAERILSELQEADLVVADLTGLSPNVMYEIGRAQALGKTVFLFREAKLGAEKPKHKHIPFYLNHDEVMPYALDDHGVHPAAKSTVGEKFRRQIDIHLKAIASPQSSDETSDGIAAERITIAVVEEQDRLRPDQLYDGRTVFVPGEGRGLGVCELLEEDPRRGLRIQIRFRTGGRYVLNADEAMQPPVYLPPRIP